MSEERLDYATWDARVRAQLLDFGLILVVAVLWGLVAFAIKGDAVTVDYARDDTGELVREETAIWAIWAVVGGLAAALLYPWIALGVLHGQTVGMRLVGIRVVLPDGRPIGLGRAFVRETLVKGALGLLSIPLLLSYLWPIWDGRRRALHDMLAATRVVTADGAPPPPPPPAGAGQATAGTWGAGGFAPPQAPGTTAGSGGASSPRPLPPVPRPPTPPPLP